MDKLPWILLVLVVGGAAAVYFTNPSLLPAVIGFAIGFVIGGGWLRMLVANKERAGTKALTKWEAEDQKLLTQVQTDREKQLEAKIATLESALQKALKKS
jgi:hypothetical protein